MSTSIDPSGFTIQTETRDNATVVELTGEFDIAQAPHAIVELRNALTRHKGPIILDVRGLTYIDSSGLAVIASVRNALEQDNRSIVAVGCHGLFEKVLHITRMDRGLTCFTSLEEALRVTGER